MAEKKFYRHTISDLVNVQKIVTVHYQELTAGYRSEEETHDFWELLYADRRSVDAVVDGRTRHLKQGEAAFVAPNRPHFVVCREEASLFIVSFECRSEALSPLGGRVIGIPAAHRALLQTVMTEAAATFRIPDFDPALRKLELRPNPNLGGGQVIKNCLELLFIYLLRSEEAVTARYFVSAFENSDDLEEAILKALSERLYGKFSLEELCAELHYGKTHLCTFFRERTGKSIYRTYLSMKLDEAKKMLRRELSEQEIADMLGFSSVSHFASAFKRHNGKTPREYAESIRK